MTSRIVAVIALALLVVGGTAAIDAAETQSADQFSVQNESWTPDAGNWTTLDDSNLDVRYSDRVTVRDENDTRMFRSDDYEWNSTDGRVKAVDGGRLENDSAANISYDYAKPTPFQESLAGLFGSGFDVAGLLVMFVLVLTVLTAVNAFR